MSVGGTGWAGQRAGVSVGGTGWAWQRSGVSGWYRVGRAEGWGVWVVQGGQG